MHNTKIPLEEIPVIVEGENNRYNSKKNEISLTADNFVNTMVEALDTQSVESLSSLTKGAEDKKAAAKLLIECGNIIREGTYNRTTTLAHEYNHLKTAVTIEHLAAEKLITGQVEAYLMADEGAAISRELNYAALAGVDKFRYVLATRVLASAGYLLGQKKDRHAKALLITLKNPEDISYYEADGKARIIAGNPISPDEYVSQIGALMVADDIESVSERFDAISSKLSHLSQNILPMRHTLPQ